MEETITHNTQSIARWLGQWRVSHFSAAPASGWVLGPGIRPAVLPLVTPSLNTVGLEFEEQKRAFDAIPAQHLAQYGGRFVASRDGEIVDSDETLATLTRRFFQDHGDVAVYITRIGAPIQFRLSSPLVR